MILPCGSDFNECSVFGMCEQKCENAIGSYKCSCVDGYTAEVSNGHLHCKANPASRFFV